MTQSFEIHDNGGRPFRATVNDSSVKVTLLGEDERQIHDLPYQRVFVAKGEAYRFAHPDFVKADFPKEVPFPEYADFEGNNLLLDEGGGSYVHVGAQIVRFQAEEPIKTFRSPMGNSNVPYAYAHSENYTYLLGGEGLIRLSKTDTDDPWGDFFKDPWGKETPYEVLTPRQG